MKYEQSLKASLIIGNILCIVLVIISSIINGIDSDRAPLLFVFLPLLIIPLVLLTIYGLRAYKNKNDSDSFLAILAISALFNLFYLFIAYGYMKNAKLFLLYSHWFILSVIMLLLWVLNVIAFLKRGK
jgi:hypothetical protein